jgi:hypothetical protein
MRHYASEQWADYARETAPKLQMAEMKRHLEAGCKKCGLVAGVWTTIAKLAQRESSYRPPDSDVHLAKSYFAASATEVKESWVPRVARLIFDSFNQPQLAGVRSSGPAPRHYVYRSGSVLVDVWAQQAAEPASTVLTGQILDRSTASQAVKHTPVKLRSKGADITMANTNQFGEFHFELGKASEADLHLMIGEDQAVIVVIPLRLLGSSPLDNGQ